MPLQNTIHGGVTETLDALLSPLYRPRPRRQGGDDGLGEGSRASPGPSSAAHVASLSTLRLKRPIIIARYDMGIRHCLVAKRGTWMGDVQWVRSHEQVSHVRRSRMTFFGRAPTLRHVCAAIPCPHSIAHARAHADAQALGQSAAFLDKHLPHAERQQWASTAGAAQSLLDDDVSEQGDARAGAGAAICSKAALSELEGLEVLYEGTQASDGEWEALDNAR